LLECVTAQNQICVIQPRCRLRRVLAEAERIQMEYLRSIKLSDVAKTGIQLSS
jgi:Rrf2 family transcriptional regulator, nitric oxide-sensitive transcriptional repressor